MVTTGHPCDSRPDTAACAERHNPALSQLLRDLRRRTEVAPQRDSDIARTRASRHVTRCSVGEPRMSSPLPEPRLTKVFRLEADARDIIDVGKVVPGQRRIVPLTGGAFVGPELNGTLLPGASADWQVVLPDGTTLGDIRYTLLTDEGDLLYVRSRGVRHGSAEVLARLGRGEEVEASEYVFRTATLIETAAADLEWLNKGIFICVGGRQPGGVIYEAY